jgi:hypothetical protein
MPSSYFNPLPFVRFIAQYGSEMVQGGAIVWRIERKIKTHT